MEKYVYLNELYDLYGELLTPKQQKYFEDYYFNNLSLSEMAEDYEVSRNAIFKQLHNVVDKLMEYESKLHLYERKMKIISIMEKNKDKELEKILEELM